MKITSLTNPRIKQLVRLRDRKARRETGLTLIDGWREIARAAEAGVEFKEMYLCPTLMKVGEEKLPDPTTLVSMDAVHEVNALVYEKIAFGDRREGVVAVCVVPQKTFRDLADRVNPCFVVVEDVEKPGNLGAILRSCDGAGIDGLIVCDERTDIYGPNCIRASLGTVFTVAVVQAGEEETREFLKQQQTRIFATTPAATQKYTDADFRGPTAIVVGSEEAGLSEFWLTANDVKLQIPMRGKADSLNVSVATALIIYEVLRQRS